MAEPTSSNKKDRLVSNCPGGGLGGPGSVLERVQAVAINYCCVSLLSARKKNRFKKMREMLISIVLAMVWVVLGVKD